MIKPFLRLDDPEALHCIRRSILGDPEATRRLVLPELARLIPLPPVLPPVGLVCRQA